MRNKLLIGILFGFILISISNPSCSNGSPQIPPYEQVSFTVESPYMQEIEFTTYDKGIIEGYFNIYGGEKDIYFYIKDPYGYSVYGPYFVTDTGNFKIHNLYTGTYTLYFDNGLSLYDRNIVLYYRGYKD